MTRKIIQVQRIIDVSDEFPKTHCGRHCGYLPHSADRECRLYGYLSYDSRDNAYYRHEKCRLAEETVVVEDGSDD